jgi:hypothetical protein
MRRNDWTPAVLATTVAVAVVAAAILGAIWLRDRGESAGPERSRRLPPPRVDAWVGDLAPGLKGVLGPVWGDPGPDLDHDRELNAGLDLPEGRGLAWYRLILFNTSEGAISVPLPEGAIAIHAPDSAAPVTLRSLSALVERGEVKPPPGGLRTVLKNLGALETTVEVPAGSSVSLLVPFGRRVDLEQAVDVASADGVKFHRRRMDRGEFQELLGSPDEARIKDL